MPNTSHKYEIVDEVWAIVRGTFTGYKVLQSFKIQTILIVGTAKDILYTEQEFF